MFDQILTPFRTYICTCIDVNIANQDYSTKIFNKIIITIGISTSITLVVYSFEGDTILQRKRKKSRELEQGPRPVVLVLKTKKHNKTCKSKGCLGPFDYNIVFNVRIYIIINNNNNNSKSHPRPNGGVFIYLDQAQWSKQKPRGYLERTKTKN